MPFLGRNPGTTTVTVADGSITTAKLADDAITSAKIADDAVVAAAIADDAVVTAAIADDAVVAAAIADNAVVTAAIADSAVTSAKTVGVTGANPNIFMNGDMSIAQRGTSSTVKGVKTVDRWDAAWGDSGGVTQSQVALTSGGAYDEGHRHAFKMAVTSTNSDNTRYGLFRQKIEAQTIRNSGWQYGSSSSYITMSFWAKSSLAGTYFVTSYAPDSGTAQFYATPFTLSANTWTKITKTIPGNSNIGINDDTGEGLRVNIYLDLGTNYTASDATIGSWGNYTSGKETTDFAQSWLNTGSATFEITGCKLEIGQSATTFEKPDYTTEFKKCQRYYWAIRGDDGPDYSANYGFNLQWSSARFSGWNPFYPIVYPAEMRGIPTFSQIGTWSASNGGSLNCTGYRTRTQCCLGLIGTAHGSGAYQNMNSTDDQLQWDAEL